MIYSPRIASYLLSFLFVLAFSAVSAQRNVLQAFETIRNHVRQYQGPFRDACDSVNCCKLSEGSCNLSTFPKDKTTLVYPGGETRCIFSDSTDFRFQVIPGDSDKVLLYFQGGGACWNEPSTRMGLCSSDATPSDLVGIFDHSNTANPYRSYTVVHVLYCSGDMHAGNVTRSYNDAKGKPVVQVGYKNTMSVFDWIKQQQSVGQFASTFSDLVIMGCSAGSVGTQIWSQLTLSSLSWKNAAVIPDSYAGVFPDGTQGPLIYDFGACAAVDASLKASCESKTLTLQDITETSIKQLANYAVHVPFSFIQSKADAVQISFYVAVGALTPDSTMTITPEEFYAEVNGIFERYNSHPNFVNFMVTGNKHCFTPYDVMYKADTTGPYGSSSGQPTMVSWLDSMPLNKNAVHTECDGELLSQNAWHGADYCDVALSGKSYA